MEQLNKYAEKYPQGSVVFYLTSKRHLKHLPHVEFGIVREWYHDGLLLEKYSVVDNRTVNGIRWKDFETPTEWKKLPKGWTYTTDLLKLDRIWHQEIVNIDKEEFKHLIPDSSENILRLIECGYFVPTEENLLGDPRVEITNRGWRIVREWEGCYKPARVIVPYHECYTTCEEARKAEKAQSDELFRQAEMSDAEWSMEKLQEALDKYKIIHPDADEEIAKIKEFIIDQGDMADIETRYYMGYVQWKFAKNKKWNNVLKYY